MLFPVLISILEGYRWVLFISIALPSFFSSIELSYNKSSIKWSIVDAANAVRFRVAADEAPFAFVAVLPFAADRASDESALLLSSRSEITSPSWIKYWLLIEIDSGIGMWHKKNGCYSAFAADSLCNHNQLTTKIYPFLLFSFIKTNRSRYSDRWACSNSNRYKLKVTFYGEYLSIWYMISIASGEAFGIISARFYGLYYGNV